MKKELIAYCVMMIGTFLAATPVKYADICTLNTNNVSDVAFMKENNVTPDTIVEIKDLKRVSLHKIYEISRTNAVLAAEFDNLLVSSDNFIKAGLADYNRIYMSKSVSPKFFDKCVKILAATMPVTANAYDKAGSFNYFNVDPNGLIAIINAKEFSFYDIDKINMSIKNGGVKAMKKYFRKNGKTFVAKKDKTGKVIFNPLEQPMLELTNALNAPKYAGLNEWADKYNVGWVKINVGWLPTDEEVRALMDDILIDERSMNSNSLVLRISLGVDKFNAFVKEYNEGADSK